MVPPLASGSRLAERFQITEVIGRGGFSIVYEALDLRRGDRAVVKEFVPPEATRYPDGVLELGPAAATLRRTFLGEAQTLSRLTIPGIVPVRLAFTALGTAYVATDAIPNAKTLDRLIRDTGGLDENGTLDLGYQLIETLEAVHAKGLLHRDVKPSNVLVGPDGRAYLLDFGAARAWSADALDAHTVVFTPGFAPPEQMMPVARRGPSTDVYGLCATLYATLTGRAPEDATVRAAGLPLTSLLDLCPEIDPNLAEAIESGLALRASERPASVTDLRKLLDAKPGSTVLESLDSLDTLLLRARQFAFDKRACPACGGVLEDVHPLGKDACPVCRRGRIRTRKLEIRACPVCRHGVLQATAGRSLFRRASPNSEAWVCDACSARMELRSDGRWHQAHPPTPTSRDFYPEEWARIAAGLDPGAGDAFCDACDADYAIHGDRITLLEAPQDPHGFSSLYLGRPLPRERVRWLAVGKSSPHSGFVCEHCHTELDRDGRDLRLIDSPNRRLDRLSGETRSLESWHRLAEGLPEVGREAEIEERIAHALAAAYRRGEVGFADLAWKGPVEFEGRETTLTAREEAIRIGRGLRIKTFPMNDLQNLRAEGDWLLADTPNGPFEVRIDPVELVGHLRSGDRAVLVSAADLAARLSWTGITKKYKVG
jgi:tRNA A-37 threonylcarbamoyl transferase component Bud32/predicted Zn-ribbon and HTH transcriptional regulator